MDLKDMLSEFAESRRRDLLEKDPAYWQDRKDLRQLEEKYMALDLSDEQRRLIEDYIGCFNSMNQQISNSAYLAGIRDSFRLMKHFDLIK